MFDKPIRPEGSTVLNEEQKEKARRAAPKKRMAERAKKRAMALATGEMLPLEPPRRPGAAKSIVNRVTEYGALFNRLNTERTDKGLPGLKTAMEVLIEAMQSNEIDLKDKAKIAEKLATFESSRAPIISIEHVENFNREKEASAEDSLEDFLSALRKV
jgi:hypothetical protein